MHYRVKSIESPLLHSTVNICMQNENGACPLLALVNALSLRGSIRVPPSSVSIDVLLDTLGNLLLELNSSQEDANLMHIIQQTVDMFPKLETGLDVNCRFDHVASFEYTLDMEVFDLFKTRVFHGWVCDPEDTSTSDALEGLSYNTASILALGVDNVELQEPESDFPIEKARLVQAFLEDNRSQLTYYGLSQLYSDVGENTFSIFFRNNHFAVLHKHLEQLYLLVTDEAFLGYPTVVWERLCEVSGDNMYYDARFRPYEDEATARARNTIPKQQPPSYRQRKKKDSCIII